VHDDGTEGCVTVVGCTVDVVVVDPEVATGVETVLDGAGVETVSADGLGEMGESVSGIGPLDDPPTVSVGVTASDSNAEDTGPELPCLLTNAAAAAPPITVERIKNFLFDDFSLKRLV